MRPNRSIPDATVIPVLAYPDVNAAVTWLCEAFGFIVRLRIGNHRVQMNVGEGAVILRELRDHEHGVMLGAGHSVHVRVEDADAHYERAKAHGARIIDRPATYPYGERQYNAEDLAGHLWTFTESVADADPADWNRATEFP